MVSCPVCGKEVKERDINPHLDSGCQNFTIAQSGAEAKPPVSSFFQTQGAKKPSSNTAIKVDGSSLRTATPAAKSEDVRTVSPKAATNALKRPFEDHPQSPETIEPGAKRSKISNLQKVAPLADRMRPRSLDEVCGQGLVGPSGVIRGLVEQDRVPSMVLWGSPGTGTKFHISCYRANTDTGRRQDDHRASHRPFFEQPLRGDQQHQLWRRGMQEALRSSDERASTHRP